MWQSLCKHFQTQVNVIRGGYFVQADTGEGIFCLFLSHAHGELQDDPNTMWMLNSLRTGTDKVVNLWSSS